MIPSFLGYARTIAPFFFREKGAITIPKSVREKAYALSLDIEIQSIANDGYFSYKSNPANSFFGYVVLVMEDFSEIEVPISLARQRLYYGIVSEAFVSWRNLYLWFATQVYWKDLFEYRLELIDAALGVSANPRVYDCPSNNKWLELPLREVYVKCPYGTRFLLEVAYWNPIPIVYDGCSFDGRSGQPPDKKDSGLPPNGFQPNRAENPNRPYSGFPLPSTDGELGDFKNDKSNNLDNPNPDNTGVPSSYGYFVEVTGVAKDPQQCSKLCHFKNIYLINSADSISLSSVVGNTSCGIPHTVVTVIGSYSGVIEQGIYAISGSVTTRIIRSASLPNGYYYCE